MQIEYIDSTEQFISKYSTFKENSKIHSKGYPIYHIGLDCEYISKSSFPESFENSKTWTTQRSHDISICLIQLANPKSCLVIDLTKLGPALPTQLIDIIKSSNWIKTGVGIDLDITYLSDNFNLGQCNGCFDIKTFANLSGCETPNLEFLNNVLGFATLDKSLNSINDWSKPLTINQLKYASNDAISSYNIGSLMVNSLKKSFNNNLNQKSFFNSNVSNVTQTISISENTEINYVGKLQELAQKENILFPTYVESIVNTKFKCECNFKNKISDGYGTNKKMAKNESAKNVFTLI